MNDRLFKNLIYSCYLILFISFCQVGCRKMNDIQKKFVDRGEITYIAKADSVEVREGQNRIELSFLLLSDPKIASYKIFWNDHLDSVKNAVHRTSEVDTIHVVLNNLKEGTHYFEIFTYDKVGNSSVAALASGRAYGDLYQDALLPRSYSKMIRNGNDLQIQWKESDVQLVKTELEYINDSGEMKKIIVPKSENLDILKDFPRGGSIQLTSAFLPSPNAIDTFYKKATITIPVTEQRLNKKQWKLVTTLPSDFIKLASPSYPLTNLWDDIRNFSQTESTTSTLPSSFTIDFGQQWQLTKLKINQYNPLGGNAFLYANIKKYEVWGSNTLSDDWSDWNLLLECESVKPSGLPYGEVTDEDKAYAAAGEDYFFPSSTGLYRYIRFRVLETWNHNNYFYFDEMTFWGWGEQF